MNSDALMQDVIQRYNQEVSLLTHRAVMAEAQAATYKSRAESAEAQVEHLQQATQGEVEDE